MVMELRDGSGNVIYKVSQAPGSPTGAKYLRDDGTWQMPPSGDGGGPHTHQISDVTGLQTALDGKAASDHTHEGGSSIPQFMVQVIANAITYTNAAAGGTEPAGQQSRVQADLRNTVNVVGQCLFSVIPDAGSGKLHFQYSTDGGSNWNTLLDMGTGGYSANTLKVSAATAVPSGAKIVNCLIRAIVHGNGTADPVCQKAMLMFQGE